jgi:superfamily II DNA/RNA helicase
MTPQQMDHHEENRKTVAQIVQKWRRFGFLRESDQRRMQIALQFMRMSCNSTYLIDQTTDHGTKASELVDVLSDMLERPDAKVVLFSQWLRMHELVVRRLESRHWQHVLFHGGVPGPKRKDLVRRFKDDPACRLFLSTDAGGVGLNLQNASAVVNLDQPWNPAVLEQRIGRVHRLGQSRPVQVVHFIAQGTIEEGMLSLLAFKKSMFTGVLDGGANEVFMGGTRLKRFMESVESATGSIPQSMPRETDRDEEERRSPSMSTEPAPTPQEGAWSDVLSAGMSLLEKFSRAIAEGKPGSASAAGAALPGGVPSPFASLVSSDPETGKPYLKLPMPEPDTVEKLVGLVAALAKGIRG